MSLKPGQFWTANSHANASASADPFTPPFIEGIPVFEALGLNNQRLPLVVVSAHSGRHYPESMTTLSNLTPTELAKGEDVLVDELVRPMMERGAVVLIVNIARVYVDVNRETNELDRTMFVDLKPKTQAWRSPRVAAGLGIIPSIVAQDLPIYTSHLPLGEAEARIDQVYHPFHTALDELVTQTARKFGGCLVVDCHSMPPIRSTSPPAPRKIPLNSSDSYLDIVIGDRFGLSCVPHISNLFINAFKKEKLTVEHNRPFAGGSITQRFAKSANDFGNTQAIQIELARSLYLSKEASNNSDETNKQQFLAISKLLCNTIDQAGNLFQQRLHPHI